MKDEIIIGKASIGSISFTNENHASVKDMEGKKIATYEWENKKGLNTASFRRTDGEKIVLEFRISKEPTGNNKITGNINGSPIEWTVEDSGSIITSTHSLPKFDEDDILVTQTVKEYIEKALNPKKEVQPQTKLRRDSNGSIEPDSINRVCIGRIIEAIGCGIAGDTAGCARAIAQAAASCFA